MKMKFVLVIAILFAVTATVNAQGGGQRRTVEERVKMIHEKVDSAFKLEPEKLTKVDTAFANYYRQQEKIRQELMSGGERPDMAVMREKMQPAIDARDKELKTILTDEQFKKWKEELEPALMQRRGGGGPGNRQ